MVTERLDAQIEKKKMLIIITLVTIMNSIVQHSQNSLEHFQGYLGICKDIDAYSATFTGGQLGGYLAYPF